MREPWIYIVLTIVTVTAIRILPVTLIKGRIRNPFIRSFLYYVPYVTLALMTFPDIVEATSSPLSGFIALGVGIVAAWCRLGLFPVAIICCLVAM